MNVIPSWAVPGRKVVCIRNRNLRGFPAGWAPKLIVGSVYTINRAALGYACGVPCAAVALEELRLVEPGTGVECGYDVTAFRPLVSQADDIATHFAVYLKTDHRAAERADA